MRRIILFLILFVCFFSVRLSAQSEEYIVKAVFLERFTRFIDWPAESTVNDEAKPFILGVIGDDLSVTLLNEIYEEQTIKNKEPEIRFYSSHVNISECDLLFISSSETKQLSFILALIESEPILTVGDTEGYAERGVMINMYIDEGNVRFEINRDAIKKAGLEVSHLLLNTAKIIE